MDKKKMKDPQIWLRMAGELAALETFSRRKFFVTMNITKSWTEMHGITYLRQFVK